MTRPQFDVRVSEGALAEVRTLADRALPFETGGIVLGTLTATGAWITTFVEVPAATPHLTRFRIPAGRTHQIVVEAKASDERIGYLGDWHTHPADSGPSHIDLATLQDLAVGTFGRRRFLALVRRSDSRWFLDLWILSRLRRPARLPYEFSGPLPLLDADR